MTEQLSDERLRELCEQPPQAMPWREVPSMARELLALRNVSPDAKDAEIARLRAALRLAKEWIDGRHDIGNVEARIDAALSGTPAPLAFDLVEHLRRQRAFSERTFGPGARTVGVIDHIRKELIEIEADPSDIKEWVDVILLAFDGAWRAGWEPESIVAAIEAKQTKSEAREWPDWRTSDPNKAIEHVRTSDPLAEVRAEIDRLEKLVRGYQAECHDVEQTLGVALGYPYPDHTICSGCDPLTGCTCGNPQVVVGDSTPASLAMEAAERIARLRATLTSAHARIAAGTKGGE